MRKGVGVLIGRDSRGLWFLLQVRWGESSGGTHAEASRISLPFFLLTLYYESLFVF